MKKNYLFLLGNWRIRNRLFEGLLLISTFFVSCAQGFDSNETFKSEVTDTQLESPVISTENFSSLMNPDGTESIKLTWPVVHGAGGYLFNVSIVDDPDNPIVLVKDSILDKCSVVFPKYEDTKYELSLKALGNKKLNNKDAVTANEYAYATLVLATKIPVGQDIAEFINANIQDTDVEQGFELEAGATYTLNSLLDLGLKTVTLRGDKINRPMVTVGENGGLVTQAGLKVKFINFDCTISTQTGFLSLSSNPSESISTKELGYKNDGATQDGFVINNPIVIQECNFKNVKNSLLYGNKKNWSLRDFRIIDCIIQFNNAESKSVIGLDGAGNGLIKSLTVKNNTFYNLVKNSSAYFIRYSNSSNAQPSKIFGNSDKSCTFTIEHNTFSHVMSNKAFANNMPNTQNLTTTIQYNIFYDVYQMYQIIQSQSYMLTAGNTIFADGIKTWGGKPHGNDIGDRKDKENNPYATLEDPDFEGPFELEIDLTKIKGGINFTPRGSIAIKNKSGDPRWYE